MEECVLSKDHIFLIVTKALHGLAGGPGQAYDLKGLERKQHCIWAV